MVWMCHFKRGSRRRFDLVVGADGLHSKVRSIVFGDESKFRPLPRLLRFHLYHSELPES